MDFNFNSIAPYLLMMMNNHEMMNILGSKDLKTATSTSTTIGEETKYNPKLYMKYIIQYLPIIIMIVGWMLGKCDFTIYYDYFFNTNVSVTITSHIENVDSGGGSTKKRVIYSDNFLAIKSFILKYMINNKKQSGNINNLKEISNTEAITKVRYSTRDSENNQHKLKRDVDNSYFFLPNGRIPFIIDEKKQIYCEIFESYILDNDGDGKKKNSEIEYVIKLYKNINMYDTVISKSEKMNDIMCFIQKCVEEYKNNYSEEMKNLYIFEYEKNDRNENSPNYPYVFREHIFDDKKFLDKNIFFEKKEELIEYIKPFINTDHSSFSEEMIKHCDESKQLYDIIGNVFKCGILLYGKPGCGKTSCIRGILNYTKRNAITVSMNRIKSMAELEYIFRVRNINKKSYNAKNLCVVIEDIDAGESDFLKSREGKNKNKNKKPETSADKIFIINNINKDDDCDSDSDDESSDKCKLPASLGGKKSDLNLASILNLLDGLIGLDNLLYIVTTNHIGHLDEAFIRVGRFDFKYEFNYASLQVISDIINLKFNSFMNHLSEEYLQKLKSIPEYKMPSVDITDIVFKSKNVEKCIDTIYDKTMEANKKAKLDEDKDENENEDEDEDDEKSEKKNEETDENETLGEKTSE